MYRTLLVGLLFPVLVATGDFEQSQARAADEPQFSDESLEFFESKVLPLLKARCFECHSSTAKRLEGGLRLDARSLVLKGGDTGPSVRVGKPNASLLMEAVNYESLEMPPRGKLPAGEIAIFRKWIELKLPWSKGGVDVPVEEKMFPLKERKNSHWAWQPIRESQIPAVQTGAWPNGNVDRFILRRLEEHKLGPTEGADRRTLIRRAYFTLIGLPPLPDEVNSFINDPATTDVAFERIVDRLLQSPHFGERWARHWLDLVRYAESLGHEFDYPLHHAHKYRDYVIRAFNRDVPYDQFVREHVAGDLMSEPRLNPDDGTNESIIGTGFWFLGELKHSPVDVKGEEAAIIDNQIDVFSKAFLGLTVSCARCHDHKFDAISTRDYYALSGYLQSSRRQHAFVDSHGRIDAAVSELTKLNDEAAAIVADGFNRQVRKQSDDVAAYLAAAREVLYGNAKPGDKKQPVAGNRPDVVFADFEGDDFGDWMAEGAAFAAGPVTGALERQQKVSGFSGSKLVNSYVGGDNATGKLTSPEFTVDRRRISFLIGGGAWKQQTCLNLLVGGKPVRTAMGSNNERLDPAVWDVEEFAGKRAVLQVVDQRKGGWGHVNVDHIVFTDRGEVVIRSRPVAVVARERSLDSKKLEQWVDSLSAKDTDSMSHPLHAWKVVASSESEDRFAGKSIELKNRLSTEQAKLDDFRSKSELLDDFEDGDSSGWLSTGWAFESDDLNSTRLRSVGEWSNDGVRVSSRRLGKRLRGVLRSPTFTLTKPTIHYRLAGTGCTVRLIIDGYVMDEFNALLYRGCKFDVKNEQPHWFRQASDVSNYLGQKAHIELIDHGDGWIELDEVRLADHNIGPVEPISAASRHVLSADSVASSDELAQKYAGLVSADGSAGREFRRWLINRGLVASALTERLIAVKKQADAIEAAMPVPDYVLAITDGTGEDEHLFIRGSHRNPGPVVPRRFLEAISGSQPAAPKNGSGRLQLADRLIDPSNPFPARVMANRIWHHLFGRGLVESTDNFGVLGKRPTHPELLDFMARRFVQNGWSIKSLIRELVLSRTWQMDSAVNPDVAESDPQNSWFHRMPIRRLEGEAIRDSLLTLSGRLDRKVYGAPVPVHLTPFMQGRGRPGSGPLDGNGRRSIYVSVRRNFLSPMMLAFDAPIPFTSMGRRNVSNVPAQALILLNDPFVIEQCQLAVRRELQAIESSPPSAVARLYERAFSRLPTQAESEDALAFLQSQAKAYGPGVDWQKDERPWTDLCHVLVNLKEFVFVR